MKPTSNSHRFSVLLALIVMLGVASTTHGQSEDFRMQTIAKYHYAAPLSIAPLSALMNKKKWDSLPKKVQQSMDKYGGSTMAKVTGGGFDKTAEIFKAKMDKASKHTYVTWDNANVDKARATMRPVYDTWIKGNKNGRMKIDALLKIITDIRDGK